MATEAPRCIHHFKAQELANAAWAFAMLRQKNEVMFAALIVVLEQRMKECTAQDISNTAWAFATLGQKSVPLFAALARAAE